MTPEENAEFTSRLMQSVSVKLDQSFNPNIEVKTGEERGTGFILIIFPGPANPARSPDMRELMTSWIASEHPDVVRGIIGDLADKMREGG